MCTGGLLPEADVDAALLEAPEADVDDELVDPHAASPSTAATAIAAAGCTNLDRCWDILTLQRLLAGRNGNRPTVFERPRIMYGAAHGCQAERGL
jgi:hypothetical protein